MLVEVHTSAPECVIQKDESLTSVFMEAVTVVLAYEGLHYIFYHISLPVFILKCDISPLFIPSGSEEKDCLCSAPVMTSLLRRSHCVLRVLLHFPDMSVSKTQPSWPFSVHYVSSSCLKNGYKDRWPQLNNRER